MMARTRAQGVVTIARLNWPFYLAAAVVLIGSLALTFVTGSFWLRSAAGLLIAASAYFLVVSLLVSFQVYDRSDLYRWGWLDRALAGRKRQKVIICHAGFDETSQSLKERYPQATWIVLDHFEAERMTEPSIRRARRLMPPAAGTMASPYDRWPIADQSADLILGLLAIHELRSEKERTAWFAEAARCLRQDGCVILAEHVRDFANFIAFGPGFIHFHSLASWQRCWKRVGLTLQSELRPSWWVRVLILVKQ